MSSVSIGDQSKMFLSRRQNAQLKSDLQRLTTELSTGRLSKPRTAAAADTAQLLALRHSLTTLDAYKTLGIEAEQTLRVAEASVGVLSDQLASLGPTLITASSSGSRAMLESASSEAGGRFASAISALNTRAGGRSLFAGTATDGAAMQDPNVILDALRAEVAGLTTADDVIAVVDAWFAAPAGYDSVAYLGSSDPLAALDIGPNESVNMSVTGATDGIREALSALALATLIGGGGLDGNMTEQAKLAETTGARMLAAEGSVAMVRAGIGAAQSQVDAALTRQGSERTSLSLAIEAYVGADPFETASALQQVTNQLETFYAVTARLSRLSLTEYLR